MKISPYTQKFKNLSEKSKNLSRNLEMRKRGSKMNLNKLDKKKIALFIQQVKVKVNCNI